jgi:hypothetical protein
MRFLDQQGRPQASNFGNSSFVLGYRAGANSILIAEQGLQCDTLYNIQLTRRVHSRAALVTCLDIRLRTDYSIFIQMNRCTLRRLCKYVQDSPIKR